MGMQTGGPSIAVPLLLLALSALTGALMEPLLRQIEGEASRYTYYACREFFAMCFVFLTIKAKGLPVVGQRSNWPWFFLYGSAQWFFMWGYVKAMASMDGSTWATLHYCSYPAFATALSLGLPIWGPADKVQWPLFVYTMVRNIGVILLMAGKALSLSGGLGWCMLTAGVNGFNSHVLRGIRKTDNALTCQFWCDLLNFLLWAPPGLLGIRADFLWPSSAPNAHLEADSEWPLSAATWAAMAGCAFLGISGILTFAWAVLVLPVAPASAAVAPLTILFALVVDVTNGEKEITAPVIAGVGLFVVSTALEVYFDFVPAADAEDDEPKAEPLLQSAAA